ncbi:putative bifunctional diguanylate cyclase/phosphodiesterase [Halorhodospira halophila]|uniref:putative bifunctional diguanylate cyclase/phosphodiesterase n=1 Tax=Halorhodospira halophila TaxID=1053 RepID=UPI001912393D|nr:GGDEF domain-containing phosphodiesterase [Halorhodospira halophila]MBK5944759.1 hypothetical protein [Halorhodospira halophila]
MIMAQTDGAVEGLRALTDLLTARDGQSLLEAAISQAGESIVITTAELEPPGPQIIYVNEAFTRITGYTPDEIVGQTPRVLQGPDTEREVLDRLKADLRDHGWFEGEAWNYRKDGSRYRAWWNIAPVTTPDSEARYLVAVQREVTELRRLEAERLHYHANFNPRTGLPNRKYTLQLLEDALHRAERLDQELAVAAVEIRDFASITQGMGEEPGDALLEALTFGLRKQLAGQSHFLGVAARGRIIAVLERPSDAEQQFTDLLRKLLEGVNRELATQRDQAPLASACAGAALFPSDGQEADALLGQAEAAAANALANGTSSIRLADAQAGARLREQLALRADLQRAVDDGELYLAYQPQVDLASGRIVGAEALLRWDHPERGPVSPGVFVPILEASGLINRVGEWTLEAAARQARAWLEQGYPMQVAVNLSARQVHASDLVGLVSRILDDTGLPQGALELEITETLLLDLDADTQAVFRELSAMGVQLALDDFGTGYSALAYLQALPLTTLKIDRAFIGDIGNSAKSEALVRGIVSLARGLGMPVVAEGIETDAQRAFVRGLGCERGQGFGLGRPMRADQLTELLERGERPAP